MEKRTLPTPDTHAAYRSMANDQKREAEALEWIEAVIADGSAQKNMDEEAESNAS